MSLLQTAQPDALPAFAEFFYAQVQQSLLWGCALLLAALRAPHGLLCAAPDACLASAPRAAPTLRLHAALLAQIRPLPLAARGALALAAGSRRVGREGVRAVLEALAEYTPEDDRLDAQRLADGLQPAQLVQAWTDAARAALRAFCALHARRAARVLWDAALAGSGEANGETGGETGGKANGEISGEISGETNGETTGETTGETGKEAANEASKAAIGETTGETTGETEAVAETVVRLVRDFYTDFQNSAALLADSAMVPRDPTPETFRTAGKEEEEEGEMEAYIEKAMATRVKVLPLEVRENMQDVWMALLRTMMKDLQEEVRANVLYDYQFRCLVVNLAFVFSMTRCLLEDDRELREIVQGVIQSAWERCYEPSEVTEQQQKSAVENGIVEFMMMVSE